jgi:hypothetical protein
MFPAGKNRGALMIDVREAARLARGIGRIGRAPGQLGRGSCLGRPQVEAMGLLGRDGGGCQCCRGLGGPARADPNSAAMAMLTRLAETGEALAAPV